MKEGNRDGRLQTDAETRPLYRKEEQIQSLPEPKIETGEMKGRVSKIRDERNRPRGSSAASSLQIGRLKARGRSGPTSYRCVPLSIILANPIGSGPSFSTAFLLPLCSRTEQHKGHPAEGSWKADQEEGEKRQCRQNRLIRKFFWTR